MREDRLHTGRRRFFRVFLAAPWALAVGARAPWAWLEAAAAPRPTIPSGKAASSAASIPPTPECGDDDEPTPAETEGPFFKPRSPTRASLLEPGIAGTKLVLTGRVFSPHCRPLPGVLLDFWHADRDGNYDNDGFHLRGHQFTDSEGRYRLETIVPGLYPGRTRHIHVRIQPPHSRILTTQLYFPGEERNRKDFLFRPDLLVTESAGEGYRQARFHFLFGSV
ncbi:MAG TPA: intradiol ring-cleavage dioxygenase [Candidatus Eisenbacteria bacterium]|jgi:protocatechuate 3,4-dioxygenase beta subunit